MRQITIATLTLLAVAVAGCTPAEEADGGPTSAPATPTASAAAPVAATAVAAPAPVASASAAPAPAPVPAAAPAVAAAPAADTGKGKGLFNDWSCGSCHTLADAGASGSIGPSFDRNAKLTRDYVVNIVSNGQGAMPSFAGQMTDEEIAAVAAYIVSAKK